MRGDRRLVAIGSSSLESASAPLVSALRAEGWIVEPRGIRGANVGDLLRVDWIGLEGADVLVYAPHNGGSTRAQIEALDAALRRAGAREVAWCAPPAFPASSPPDVIRAARVTAHELSSARVATKLQSPALGPRDLGPDRVHLSAYGARALARWWTRQLSGGTFGRWVVPVLAALAFYVSIK